MMREFRLLAVSVQKARMVGAMRTLMFERGAIGGQAGGLSAMDLNINDIIELARRSVRNGRPALRTPHTR